MNDIQDYFLCDNCANKDFKLVYNFSLKFNRVNFSDSLIYDKLTKEMYQCTKCQKIFTKKQIEDGLDEHKKRRKND